jgi:DNA-binding MarR family transcriptional regulator
MEQRSSQALIALRRILRVTELNSRKLASQSELTASQLIVLQHAARNGKALPSEIARTINLKQATITVLVNKLEDAGLVTRRRDTEDRRRVWVEPTDAGRALLETSPDLLQDRFSRQFDALEDWQQAMIIAALEKIAVMLDAGEIDASPVLDVGDLDRIMARDQAESA